MAPSRSTVSQVVGALSPVPKHPQGVESPRNTAELKTAMNAKSSPTVTVDVTGRSQPASRYKPSKISKGGSATAMTATRGPGSPSRNPVIVAARSAAWLSFKTPAMTKTTPSDIRITRGTT